MDIEIKETRGRKRKYDFSNMEIGETRSFIRSTTIAVLNSAKRYSDTAQLGWKFRCFTDGKITRIVRVK